MNPSHSLDATLRAPALPRPSSSSVARPSWAAAASAVQSAVRSWWSNFRLDERTRYLAQASDTADLEARIRRWDQADRRSIWPSL